MQPRVRSRFREKRPWGPTHPSGSQPCCILSLRRHSTTENNKIQRQAPHTQLRKWSNTRVDLSTEGREVKKRTFVHKVYHRVKSLFFRLLILWKRIWGVTIYALAKWMWRDLANSRSCVVQSWRKCKRLAQRQPLLRTSTRKWPWIFQTMGETLRP